MILCRRTGCVYVTADDDRCHAPNIRVSADGRCLRYCARPKEDNKTDVEVTKNE